MANKLLILGAAMAHRNKSYNLSRSIVPAVDASVKNIVDMVKANQKRIGEASLLTQQYLDQLPENPEIDLLDENMAADFTNNLNASRNKIGELNMARYVDPYKYSPGSEAYTNLMSELKKEEKNLKSLLKDATAVQTAKANWIKEHANISPTWKLFNADKYEALSKILNSENPQGVGSRNEKGEYILTADVNGKKVSVKVDELDDWEQYPQRELNKINEFYTIATTKGQQGQDLTAADKGVIRNYLNGYLGENENALFSLMFDDLPMGNNENKMALFTDEEFNTMFDINKDGKVEGDELLSYDFADMKEKVVNRLTEKIVEENTTAKTATQNANIPVEFTSLQTAMTELASVKNKSADEILEFIRTSSIFAGAIGPVNTSAGKFILTPPNVSTADAFNQKSYSIKTQIDQFKEGNMIPLLRILAQRTGIGDSDALSVNLNKLNEAIQKAMADSIKGEI
jgi:hypothetical protein